MGILSTVIDRSGKTVMLSNTQYGKIVGCGQGSDGALLDIDRKIQFRRGSQKHRHHGPEINKLERRGKY